MRRVLTAILLATTCAATPLAAQTPAKRTAASANDLPVYTYQLPGAPSAVLEGPLPAIVTLAEAVVRDDAKTEAEFNITDLATRERLISNRVALAQLRRDVPTVRKLAAELRSIQTRSDRKLTAGVMGEILAETCASPNPAAIARPLAEKRLGALPWAESEAYLRPMRASMVTANRDLVIGSVKGQLDPIVAKNGNKVDQTIAGAIVAARVQLDCLYPVAPQLAAAVGAVIDRQSAASPRADIWAARQVALTPSMPGRPVAVGIWDSGVDMSLFRPAADPGLAVDGEARPATSLLRPTGQYTAEVPKLLDLIKGALDLRAGVGSPEASAYQTHVSGLKAGDAKAFTDAMGFAGLYMHGTHVAGIAVEGNPFARVFAVSQHYPARLEDNKLDRAIVDRRAAFYGDAVARMRKAGVRVVNMSWRVSPAAYEGILQVQGGMPDAAARKALAQELYAIEKRALDTAIRSAPEILFVAGAGNETNDASFADYIPAGLDAPNLLTVGAVDKAGREAVFTSVGNRVALYANGVEVESYFPGGKRRQVSGTSMASPQVANTAAKLAALKPALTGAEMRAILVDSGDAMGRVKLLNPRQAFARAGVATALTTAATPPRS